MEEGLQRSPEVASKDKKPVQRMERKPEGVYVCLCGCLCLCIGLSGGKLSERSLRRYLLIWDSLFKTPLKLQHLPPDSHSLRFGFNEALGSSPGTFIQPHFCVCLFVPQSYLSFHF